MNSLKIDTGIIEILVNDDPSRVIRFNPNDVVMAEKVYHIVDELPKKSVEYGEKGKEIWSKTEKDENGLPLNFKERCDYLHDLHNYFCGQIDDVFGDGTSKTLYGDFVPFPEEQGKFPNIYEQFFTGILPYFQKVRAAKMDKYAPEASRKRKGHKVM